VLVQVFGTLLDRRKCTNEMKNSIFLYICILDVFVTVASLLQYPTQTRLILSSPSSVHRSALARKNYKSRPFSSPRKKTPNFICHRESTIVKYSPCVDTLAATSTILISSTIGFLSNQLNHFSSGTIVTLVLALLITNNAGLLGISVPISHPIYDLCWSKILPASLALILFSGGTRSYVDKRDTLDQDNSNEKNLTSHKDFLSTKELIVSIGIPFIIGSIGSILGCLFSTFLILWASTFQNQFIKLSMNPTEVSIAAGCLSASYIGGSVNFFAAARIISTQLTSSSLAKVSYDVADLISAMAAADLIIMAFYFGCISPLMSWKRLRKWFPSRTNFENDETTMLDPKQNGEKEIEMSKDTMLQKQEKNVKSTFLSGIVAVVLVGFVVEVSSGLEKYTSSLVPGLGCAYVATFATLIVKSFTFLTTQRRFALVRKYITRFQYDLNKFGPKMSDYCFHLLFAAIGTSANLSKAMSHGPSCFVFAIVSLLIHIIVIFSGSAALMKAFPMKRLDRIFPLSLEEVMVASNAAIGGASTAAAFAGNLGDKGVKRSHNCDNNGMVLAATFWGIVGYAFATTIGVSLTRILLSALV